MIRRLFERKASYEAEVLAEAQALVDDGLELEFVLGLFPDDADWLEPLLVVSSAVVEAGEGEPASYYFEASLKSKFLGAAREPQPAVPVVLTAPGFSPLRTAVASMSVISAAAVVGILALGFVTAGDSVPGDWNYTFKLANERFEYTLSRGDGRIDAQLQVVQNRVYEVQQLSSGGQVSASQLERVQREFDELRQELARRQDLDAARRAQLESVTQTAAAAINDIAAKQPELAEPARAAAAAIDDTVTVLAPKPTVTPTATSTASAAASATPEPSATATGSPTEQTTPTPAPSETASPAASTTPTPAETATQQPVEVETETASPTTAP